MPVTSTSDMITDAQRRAIFAWGRQHGKGIDDLRAMTPAGSISMLTKDQASQLLDGLNRDQPARPKRRKRRSERNYRFVSPAQLRKIESLRIELGWSPEFYREFMSERHFKDGRPMTQIDSTDDGRHVIETLKGIVVKDKCAKENRQRSAADVSAA